MKRKAFLAAVFCLIILSCVSAGKFSIVGQVSPYSLQTVTLQSGRHSSSYGFGFTAGGRYNIIDNLTAGIDFNLDVFNYREIENKYLVIGFMAKAGYSFDFSDKVFNYLIVSICPVKLTKPLLTFSRRSASSPLGRCAKGQPGSSRSPFQ